MLHPAACDYSVATPRCRGYIPQSDPLGPLGFNSPEIAQPHALHVERTAEKAFMLSDRIQPSSAEALVEEINTLLGCLGEARSPRSLTHQAQVSRSEAHGISWLEQKISNHGHPTR